MIKSYYFRRLFFVFCMIFSLSVFMSISAKADNGEVETWDQLARNIENGKDKDLTFKVKEKAQLVVTKPIQIKNGQRVIISGHASIKRAGNYNDPFFEVTNGSLEISGVYDSSVKRLEFDGSGKVDDNSRLANVGKNGKFVIGNYINIHGFCTKSHGNVVENEGYLEIRSTVVKGEGSRNGIDDIYQAGEMNITYNHDYNSYWNNPSDVNLRIFITNENKTIISSNMFVKNNITLDVSDNIKDGDQLVKVKMNNVGAKGFEAFYKRKQPGVFKKGKGLFSIDQLDITEDGIKLKSNIKTEPKNVLYNGSTVTANDLKYSARDLSSEVRYTYYTDRNLVNKTTPTANGSKSVGGAPSNAGTYYVLSSIKDKKKDIWWKRGVSELKITQAKGDIAVNNQMISTIEKNNANIKITKNFGNPSYKVSSSNSKVVQVSKSNNAIVCKALRCGESTITIATDGNKNVTPCSVKVTVKVAPAQIKIKKAKSSEKGNMKVQWKVSKTATGYDFQYARDSKFKKKAKTFSVLCSKAKKGIGKAKNLKSKATYYVRIRAYYQAPNGEKMLGPWSKKKKVKIK